VTHFRGYELQVVTALYPTTCHKTLVTSRKLGLEQINLIFARNGLAYELQEGGRIVRLGPTALREALAAAIFQSGDSELDTTL